MPKHITHLRWNIGAWIYHLSAVLLALGLLLFSAPQGRADDKRASNKHPLSFGQDQTIIDLQHVGWEPLSGEGVPPGAEFALLRGNLVAGGGEALIRFPANYTFPNYSHTSDELYIWLQGAFTYIVDDGTATELSGQAYISLPGGAPRTLRCGPEPCVFYARYSRPFHYTIHPMPARKN